MAWVWYYGMVQKDVWILCQYNKVYKYPSLELEIYMQNQPKIIINKLDIFISKLTKKSSFWLVMKYKYLVDLLLFLVDFAYKLQL